nr:MAG TPA: hypothetical protein [Caudoviricetes sp.]
MFSPDISAASRCVLNSLTSPSGKVNLTGVELYLFCFGRS